VDATLVSATTTDHKCTSEQLVCLLRFLLSQLKAHTLIKILDEAADLSWPEDTEAFKEGKLVHPGDNVEMDSSLLHRIALEPGQRFNVREGGRTVATGLVTRIID